MHILRREIWRVTDMKYYPLMQLQSDSNLQQLIQNTLDNRKMFLSGCYANKVKGLVHEAYGFSYQVHFKFLCDITYGQQWQVKNTVKPVTFIQYICKAI